MGAFAELQAGLISFDEVINPSRFIKKYPLNFDTDTSYDELDKTRIKKIKEVLKLKIVKKMSAVEQAKKMFENTENYLVIFNKDVESQSGGWHDFIGIKGQINKVQVYEGEPDSYIGAGSYVSKKYKYNEHGKRLARRTQDNMLDIVNLTQDLDFYKDGKTEDEAIEIIAKLIFEEKLEMPHLLIYSGKGLQLVWLIDNVFAKKGSGPERLFKAVQSYLMDVLKELRPDKVVMTPSNVIRLAHTINSKNGAEVRTYILRSDRVKLGHFKEKYLPIPVPNRKVPKPKKAIEKPRNDKQTNAVLRDTRLWNEYSLNYQRAHDVFRVVEFKQGQGETLVGIRNHLALVLAFHTLVYSGDYEMAEEQVEALWELFEDQEETSLEEIKRRALLPAIRYYQEWLGEIDWRGKDTYAQPGLFYKNVTLIKHWDLSKECQINLKTIKIRDDEYNRLKQELYRRKNGDLSRKEYLGQFDEKKQKGIELKEKGFKYKEIAAELGVSVDTVKGWFRKKK